MGLDIDYYAGCDFGSDQGVVPTIRWTSASAAGRLEGFDAVVHLAALSNDPLGDLNEAWTHQINLDGTWPWPARPVRPVCVASCSRRRARCTARQGPTTAWTRRRHSARSHRMPSRRSGPKRASGCGGVRFTTRTMRFTETDLPDAFVIDLDRWVDERGFFARVWCRDEFAAADLTTELAQCSISRSTTAGTLRGMHFQRAPHEEAKLVRCTRGAIYDVIVDLRPSSAARGRWTAVRRRDLGQGSLRSEGFRTRVPDARGRHGRPVHDLESGTHPEAATASGGTIRSLRSSGRRRRCARSASETAVGRTSRNRSRSSLLGASTALAGFGGCGRRKPARPAGTKHTVQLIVNTSRDSRASRRAMSRRLIRRRRQNCHC